MLTTAQDNEKLIERVAALDIGKAELMCCVRVPDEDHPGRRLQEVQAYPTLTNVTATNLQGSDIFLALDTVCLRTVSNVPNGIGGTVNGNICDPTGGFRFTDGRSGDRSDTLHNFGKIVNLHGRRIVEFALKFEF